MQSFEKKNTELCKYILHGEKCPYIRCNYAHKKEELRERQNLYHINMSCVKIG